MTESTPGTDTGPYTETSAGSEFRSDVRSEAGSGARPEAGTGARPEAESGARPEAGTGARPEAGSGARPEAGSGARPEAGPDTGSVEGGGLGSDTTTGADPTSTLRVDTAGGSVAGTVSVPGPGHVARPLTLGGGLAVVSAVLAVLLVANAAGQVVALAIGLAGTAGLVLGIEARNRGHRLLGIVLGTLGVVGVGAGLAWAVIGTQDVQHRLEILPGIVGLAVLAVAVRGTGRGYERLLVSVGTGAILLGVFVSGMVEGAPVWAMLAATAATVVAWDTGEQAINLGQQIGRQSRTRRAELVHLGGSAAVGALGVGVAIGFVTVGVSGLPLVGLTTLLAAVVLLAAGLYL